MEAKELPVRKFECMSCKYTDYRMSTREVGEIVPNECHRCGKDVQVVGAEYPNWLAGLMGFILKHFEVLDFVAVDGRVEAEVTAQDPKSSFRALLSLSKPHGYLPVMREKNGKLMLALFKSPKAKTGNIAINLLLFVATFLTTFLVGYFFIFVSQALQAALFSCAIMLMLGIHEMGHKIAAWRNGVESTLPYFIPAPPPFIGTFGAVINIKSPIPTKEALVELGASGPLLGFFVALPLTVIGLMLSKPDPEGTILPFTLVMFAVIQVFTFGYVPAAMRFNPLALAGWLALFVTMLNLIPAGQLDGGHIARGLLGRERHYTLTRILGFVLFLTFIPFPDLPLWIWGFVIILFFRGYHPGALDDVSGLSGRQKLLAAVALIVFILCLPLPVG
jgi:membrane-associated protease RseP (regulator of RpoE activity)